jgi:hypothetical protein
VTQDLQYVHASADILKEDLEATRTSATTAREEMCAKLAVVDELVV